MTVYLRMAGAIIVGTALVGCATTQPPAAAVKIDDPNCLTNTGSRISLGPNQCRGVGRSYSSQDIERTGATSAAGALSLLDSSVVVHH